MGRIAWPLFLMASFPATGVGQTTPGPEPQTGATLLSPTEDLALEDPGGGFRADVIDRNRRALSFDEACDSDLEGAVIGTFVGMVPGILRMLSERQGGEALVPGVVLMTAGGFLGFWAGLAIDSLDCPFDSAEGEAEPE